MQQQSRALARRARAAMVALLASAPAACSDSTGVPPAEPTPTRVTVRATPARSNVLVGAATQLVAEVHDEHGRRLRSVNVSWRSLDPEIAEVTRGLATGRAAGSARMVASLGDAADTVVVTVTTDPQAPGVLASLSLSPSPLAVRVGQIAPLVVTARDAHGTIVSGASVSWRSLDPSVASVSATGAVTGIGVGTTRVVASASGHADTVEVRVSPAAVASVGVSAPFGVLARGQTGQLVVTLRDAAGDTLTGRATSFSSSAPSIATVSGAGVVTALAVGSATITATSEGVSGKVVVRVETAAPVVGSVVVSPSSVTLERGGTRVLTATVRDAGGVVLDDHPVSWQSANAGVATVSGNGTVTAVAAGSTTITASAGGRSATVAVTVTQPAAPIPVDVSVPVAAVGTVAEYDLAQFFLPDVMVVGDDDSTGVAPMQAFVTYSLADIPAGAQVEKVLLTIQMHPSGVFGDPFALGPLVAERATTLALRTSAPGAGAVMVTDVLRSSVTVDVTQLVREERAAGSTSVTFRLRLTTPRDHDGDTDQLELSAGDLRVTYLK